MTLRHFKIFLAVCQEKNMTKAAKKLYMTQPSVSQAIKELEAHYNTELFERIGKKINISKNGYLLIPLAENIIKLFEETENIMTNKENVKEIRLGASITIGTYLLGSIIQKINRNFNIKIKSTVDNTKNIEKMILDSQLDFGLVEGEIISKYIKTIPLLKDELVLVVSSNNPLAQYDSIRLRDLNGVDFILREEGSGTKDQISYLFHQNRVEINEVATVNNIEAIKNMIIDDVGVSILPKLSIKKEKKAGILKDINIRAMKIERTFKLAYHKDKIIDESTENFIDILKELN